VRNGLRSLLLTAFLALPSVVMAGPNPEATIESLNAGLLGAMSQPEGGGYQARFDRLDPLMQSAFDYPLMAQIAVGKYWAEFSEAERARYLELFSDVSVAAAASRFRERPGVGFEVTGTREGPQGGKLVDTLLTVGDGEPRKISYLLKEISPGDWRAIDVYYDGSISELATKRSEYTSVIKMQGAEALFDSLQKKLASYAKE
jgi:phospholipid transport system substrate-binding protein